MPASYVYDVKVGKNVASLKGYHNPKKPRLHLERLEEGALSSRSPAKMFELPFLIVLAGLVLGLLSYQCFTWKNMSIYVTMSLGFLFLIAGAVVVIYGIGAISQRYGFVYENQQGQYWRRFFWITRHQKAGRPDHVYCTGTPDPESPGCYFLDVCLHYAAPMGPISVTHVRGYAKIPAEKGAQYTAFENAMIQIHEKAQEIAEKLDLPFKPNFSAGPVSDQLAEFFRDSKEDDGDAGAVPESKEGDKAED